MNLLADFLRESISLWIAVSPYLLLGMVFSGLLHVFLGKEVISRHLGKGNILSVIKATLLGIPLPVCSCGVIPLASSLRKDGAHKSSVLSFLVSTPTTGIDSFLATYSLLGPLFAIFRPLGALVSGVIVGGVDYVFGGRKEKLQEMPKHKHIKISHSFKFGEFLRFSFLEIPNDIGKWLLVGVFFGGLIAAALPDKIFSQYLSFPLDILVALIVSVPLYVCATGSIPIAAALIYKGLSPGAALVFLIAGPATNAITLSFVRAKLGKKSFYVYLGSIVGVAVGLGFVFNWLWNILGKNVAFIAAGGNIIPFEVRVACGIILFVIVLNALLKKEKCNVGMNLEISVPDIHCSHCKIALQQSFNKVPDIEDVYVDVDKKVIKIKGTIKREKALEKIKEAGYHPQE